MVGSVKEESESPETELSGDISGKLNGLLTESDDESELSHEVLVVEEEKLEEIMQELYKEITSTTSTRYNSLMPSSSSLDFFPVSDVKISESCGASMSDSSSTVMAGIEFVGPTGDSTDVKGGLPGSEEKEIGITSMGVDGGEKMERWEEAGDDDDQWLARVLGWGPLELEGWTSTFLSC